jgi:hypothetical protein
MWRLLDSSRHRLDCCPLHINYKGDDILVRAFAFDETSDGAIYHKVSKYKKHPNYKDNASENDFALLKLQSPVTLSTTL